MEGSEDCVIILLIIAVLVLLYLCCCSLLCHCNARNDMRGSLDSVVESPEDSSRQSDDPPCYEDLEKQLLPSYEEWERGSCLLYTSDAADE